MPDSPASRSAVKQALASHPVSYMRVAPGAGGNGSTSEIMIELPRDDGLTRVLSALHAISPQVFVSRADAADVPPGHEGLVPETLPGGNG